MSARGSESSPSSSHNTAIIQLMHERVGSCRINIFCWWGGGMTAIYQYCCCCCCCCCCVSSGCCSAPRVSRCIALLAVLTLCVVATAGGNGRCRGCHQKHKWDHCACGGKTELKTILNLAPGMSAKPRLMGKRGLWITSPFTEHKSC